MKISGFTFVRNAVKYDYPVVESISSILPIVDEFIVSVGNSEDNTLQLIESIASPKIKIIHSVWDDSLREGGKVLAVETDKSFAHISPESDWAFYLQADEVVHEKYHTIILQEAKKHLGNQEVEGLLFRYLHFYGTYNYIGDTRRWYNREIRIIRNDKNIHSYRDAQGFRKNGEKLQVKLINAFIYHYGWVKSPQQQKHKVEDFHIYWSRDQQAQFKKEQHEMFDYLKDADILKKFEDTHPACMQKRIQEKNWDIPFDLSRKKLSFKDSVLYKIEKMTGKRLFDYKNYRII
ncbi:MAG: glycosyltransferase family 2 protein [Bacteroidetes bacterium]|nr:glycosyltransferase family 2 protein [Bacteroidota bacterium]MBS1930758.1 glycosyltransferase family 2 protein [Bacteroidota bacterium]